MWYRSLCILVLLGMVACSAQPSTQLPTASALAPTSAAMPAATASGRGSPEPTAAITPRAGAQPAEASPDSANLAPTPRIEPPATTTANPSPVAGAVDQRAASDAGTCCVRRVGVVPLAMPAGQLEDYGAVLASTWEGAVGTPEDAQCPLIVDFTEIEQNKYMDELINKMLEAAGSPPEPEMVALEQQLASIDYLFRGIITVDEQTGRFTLTMQLIDNHHPAVVREARTSWSGTILQGIDALTALGATLKPLPSILRVYEALPQHAEIVPEQQPVPAGTQIHVRVSGLVDARRAPSQPWWRVLIKAEKGKILNGTVKDDFRVFKVGDSGVIDVLYQAPSSKDSCTGLDGSTDTLVIYNTCQKCDGFEPTQEDEFARASLRISCPVVLEVTQRCYYGGIFDTIHQGCPCSHEYLAQRWHTSGPQYLSYQVSLEVDPDPLNVTRFMLWYAGVDIEQFAAMSLEEQASFTETTLRKLHQQGYMLLRGQGAIGCKFAGGCNCIGESGFNSWTWEEGYSCGIRGIYLPEEGGPGRLGLYVEDAFEEWTIVRIDGKGTFVDGPHQAGWYPVAREVLELPFVNGARVEVWGEDLNRGPEMVAAFVVRLSGR